jgi:hypothetical protein
MESISLLLTSQGLGYSEVGDERDELLTDDSAELLTEDLVEAGCLTASLIDGESAGASVHTEDESS